MSQRGVPVVERSDCRYCGTPFKDVGIVYHRNRQFCGTVCRDKDAYEKREVKRANEALKKTEESLLMTGEDAHAGRAHGTFFIKATEKGQSKRLKESFFCWGCLKEHTPKEIVETLGLKCECGFFYVFTIGIKDGASYLVRVDRIA